MVLLEALSGMENPVLDYVNTRLDGATRHQVGCVVLEYDITHALSCTRIQSFTD